ncbi:MAG: hypothetical protein QOI53_3459 [Verrucomicrobiota bacterium]|nr:hypothetical protein [Verrucomicrobiota bacterium]
MLSRLVKANSDWMIPSIPGFVRSFVVFAISVWIVFSDRNFTHRDRKVRKDQFGLADPFDSVVLRFFAFFATSVWNRRFASRLLGDGLGWYRSLMKDYQN